MSAINGLAQRTHLNNGVSMPGFGVGAFTPRPEEEDIYTAVRRALEIGYRLVDTAEFYNTEQDVGRAVKDSGLAREEVFVISKIWLSSFIKPEQAIENSLRRLDMDYVDMYLIHWPGTDSWLRMQVWEAIIKYTERGLIKAPGVANFMAEHIVELMAQSGVAPVIDQIELHPWYQQRAVRECCKAHNIGVMAWSPLASGHIFKDETIKRIAQKYGRSMAQVILRWDLQQGIVPIPKSVYENELLDNVEIFDFQLAAEDMALLDALDGRGHCSYDQYHFNGNFAEADERAKSDPLHL